MYFSVRCAAVSAVSLMVVGCSIPGPPTGFAAPIPVAQFVNSLKCEYATFLSTYKGQRLNLKGWIVSGSMELNVLAQTTDAGGVVFSGLVPFQGASIDFGLSRSVDRKFTTDTTIAFQVTSKADDRRVCDRAHGLLIDGGIGYGDWLKQLANSLDSAAAGNPKFAVSELDYELIFAVTQTDQVNGGVGISILPLKVTASALASRNDVQTIKVKMTPPNIVVGHKPDGTPITKPNVHPFFVPIDPRTFSPMVLPNGK